MTRGITIKRRRGKENRKGSRVEKRDICYMKKHKYIKNTKTTRSDPTKKTQDEQNNKSRPKRTYTSNEKNYKTKEV